MWIMKLVNMVVMHYCRNSLKELFTFQDGIKDKFLPVSLSDAVRIEHQYTRSSYVVSVAFFIDVFGWNFAILFSLVVIVVQRSFLQHPAT